MLLDEGAPAAERAGAAEGLGRVGDADLVAPELSALLARCGGRADGGGAQAELVSAIENSLWAIWLRAPEHHSEAHVIDEAMVRGMRHMQTPVELPLAVEVFSDVIAQAPSFAEAVNKRATALYLLGELERSVADCRTVLNLNPHHFGALSGLGMCFLRLGRPHEAKSAFEEALRVNPTMNAISDYVVALEEQLKASDAQ